MSDNWWVPGAVAGIAFLASVYVAWRYALPGDARAAERAEEPATAQAGPRWQVLLLFLAALAVRLWLAVTTKGHPADIGTFSAWAGHAAEGLTSFYSPGYFADYPPGYIYVLWAVGKLRLLLGWEFGTKPFLALLKLPPMLSDLATAWLLYRLAAHRWSHGAALVVAALYALSPMVILDSAVWGQVDGVLTLFLLVGLLLLKERPGLSGASFAAALLIKPQALIFAPVPLLWFAVRLLRQRDRETAADLLAFAGAGILLFCLGALPFAAGQDIGWLLEKYGTTLASYPFASFNAFNLFALIGANLAPVSDRLLFLPYSAWGTLFLLGIVLYAGWITLQGRDPRRFWYVSFFLAVSVFVFSAKMHERYMFPAAAFGLGLFAVTRDRRALALYAGFTITLLLNIAQVLALSYREVFAVPRLDPLLLGASFANVLLWCVLAWTGYDWYLRAGRRQPTPD